MSWGASVQESLGSVAQSLSKMQSPQKGGERPLQIATLTPQFGEYFPSRRDLERER
jgi:hypothetical protein